MSLVLKNIQKSHTIGQLVELVNYNFAQILANGGGPKGEKGDDGIDGIDGATIITQGDKGDSGSSVKYTGNTLSDGQSVVDPEHLEGDTIIDATGAYYEITETGGQLYYTFRISIPALSNNSYLLSKTELDAQAANGSVSLNIFDPSSANVLAAVRLDNGDSTDKILYRRLILGDSPSVLATNSTLTIANVVAAGTTDATSQPFSQISLKYRAGEEDGLSAISTNLSTYISGTDSVGNIETGNVRLRLLSAVDADDNSLIVKARNLVLNGNSDLDSPASNLSIVVDPSSTSINSASPVEIEAPIKINRSIGTKYYSDAVDNNSTTTLDVGSDSLAGTRKLTITIPSDSRLGRITSITGGYDGQIITIINKNAQTEGIIIDQTDNVKLKVPVRNLKQHTAITLVKDGTDWYELCSSTNDNSISYISSDDISFDFDNLTMEGTWYVYFESSVDKLADKIQLLQSGLTSFIPNTNVIANSAPHSGIGGYDVITEVRTLYNGICIQTQTDVLDGNIATRRKLYDGTWSDWVYIKTYNDTEDKWVLLSYNASYYADANLDVSSGNHRMMYKMSDDTYYLKISSIGTVSSFATYVDIWLPDGADTMVQALGYRSSGSIIVDPSGSPSVVPVMVLILADVIRIYPYTAIPDDSTIAFALDVAIPL